MRKRLRPWVIFILRILQICLALWLATSSIWLGAGAGRGKFVCVQGVWYEIYDLGKLKLLDNQILHCRGEYTNETKIQIGMVTTRAVSDGFKLDEGASE